MGQETLSPSPSLLPIDLVVYPNCDSPMRILAVITDPPEVKKILRHLIKIGRPPLGRQPSQRQRDGESLPDWIPLH